MSTQVLKQGSAFKKKLRKWEIALIVIAIIIALVGGGLLYIFWDVIFSKASNADLGPFPDNFGYFSDINNYGIYKDYSEHFAQFEEEIQAGMAEDATDEEKALAAYIIYRVACLSNSTAPEYAKYTTGGGSATGDLVMGGSIQVGGSMKMTSTYYNIAAEEGKYTAQEEYTQVPKGAITASEEGLAGIGELLINGLLPFARRSIVTPDETVTWNGDSKSSKITETGVTGTFEESEKSFTNKTAEQIAQEAKYNRPYGEDWYDEYGLSSHDLSIHIINPQTIIPSTVKITEEIGSDLNGKNIKYYIVEFEVDTETNRGTEQSATYYAEQLYLANAPLDFLNELGGYSLYYSELKVNMTVFQNGYIRTWETDETWVMQANVNEVNATCTLTSVNYSTEAYCYDHDTIMQGFVNRWIGDSEYVNKPMEDLPFYDELEGYEKEAYGTYR
ncbi:MAG: hypothetical protein IJ033_04565 [Clostridia bacterium]|nr:hypothetical protein [Clostridia bacterium]